VPREEVDDEDNIEKSGGIDISLSKPYPFIAGDRSDMIVEDYETVYTFYLYRVATGKAYFASKADQ